MAAGLNHQLAEGSWPGIKAGTDILAPPMSLDRTRLTRQETPKGVLGPIPTGSTPPYGSE